MKYKILSRDAKMKKQNVDMGQTNAGLHIKKTLKMRIIRQKMKIFLYDEINLKFCKI